VEIIREEKSVSEIIEAILREGEAFLENFLLKYHKLEKQI
jgi:hypothetical protein